jgi:hypothetical protein
MWLAIVGVLSLAVGILALIGLLAVARELFRETPLDADFADAGGATSQHDVRRANRRRRVTTP